MRTLLTDNHLSQFIKTRLKAKTAKPDNPAEALVHDMVNAISGKNRLYALKEVEYEYTYLGPEGKEDVSTER